MEAINLEEIAVRAFREIGNGSSGSYAHPDIDSQRSVAKSGSRLNIGASTSTIVHKYPLFLDRGKQSTKIEETARECIRFTVVKQGGVTLKSDDYERSREDALKADIAGHTKTIDGDTSTLYKLYNQVSGLTESAAEEKMEKIDALKNKIAHATGKRAVLQGPDGKDALDLWTVGDHLVRRTFGRARTPAKAVEHCFLYMPPSVVYNEGATWGMESVGAMGNAVKQMIKGKGDIGSILADFGAGVAAPVAKAMAIGVGVKIAGAFGGLATALGGGGVVSGISQAARVVQNPYEEQLFAGIPFRVFNFSFEFIATRKTEFEEVSKIITMFRKHSRPTFTIEAAADGTQSEAFYSYPNEFNIEFMHLSEADVFQRNEHLPRIHNCVLTNITTNYAPDGWQAHEDGEPASIVVQLAFTETKKNTRHDVEEGF